MKKWVPILIGSGLAIGGGLLAGGLSIYNKISYDVLSYNLKVIGANGMTIRIVFGVTNDSNVSIELWNQKYDVFVSGYKLAEITSEDRYLLLANSSSLVPVDVDIFWDELNTSAPFIGSQLQVGSIANLPFIMHGKLAVRAGLIQLRKLPVRWMGTIGNFLP